MAPRAAKIKFEEEILRSLRKITRAIDLHSRALANAYGLTGPQLVCLRFVNQNGHTTPGAIADAISLSRATITGIVDRLEARQLVERDRTGVKDRRVVHVRITEAGKSLVEQAPSPLQETFAKRLASMKIAEQRTILESLQRVVQMMGGDEIEADPVLSTDSSAPSEVTDPVVEKPT